MSPPNVWGPAVWTLFHALSEKVSEEAYPFIKFQLFSQIKRICGFLPCPECSADATKFLAKININDLKTKIDFKNVFYLFHNWVNAKKRKPLFNYSNLSSYNNYGIIPIINNFIHKYNTHGNMNLIAESFQRKLVVNEFKSWITKTIMAFKPPQNIPSLVSVTTEESTNVPENDTIIDEVEVVTVSEEVVTLSQEVVTVSLEVVVTEEEVVVTEEEVVTLSVEEVVTEEVVVTEEEVVATEEEVVVTVTKEEVVTVTEEEVVTVTEEVVTVTEEVVTVTEEEVVSEEVVSEEVVAVQVETKKGRKYKKR
jgi:hypothetical protein